MRMKIMLELPEEKIKAWQLKGLPSHMSDEDKSLIEGAISEGVLLDGDIVVVDGIKMPENCRHCPINSNGECNFVVNQDYLVRPVGCPLKNLKDM